MSTTPHSDDHEFGGAWTEIKLDAVEEYLRLYTRALHKQPFELWYVDAFAGSGSRTVARESGGLLEGRPIEVTTETLSGSARRALEVEPPFNRYLFVEQNARRFRALENLRVKYSSKKIECVRGNANSVLQNFANSGWARSKKGRAVVFLDPYSLQVEWKTLVALAKSGVIDVWYLFPLRDVTRQLARDFNAIDQHKTKALNRVLGPNWKQLYETRTERGRDLFEEVETTRTFRRAEQLDIEHWFRGRLANTFRYCSEPLPLLTDEGRQIFSLFLAVSNPSEAAIKLAKKFAEAVISR